MAARVGATDCKGCIPLGRIAYRPFRRGMAALAVAVVVLAIPLILAASASALSFGLQWANYSPSELEVVHQAGATVYHLPIDKAQAESSNWATYDEIFERASEKGIAVIPYLVRTWVNGNEVETRFPKPGTTDWNEWADWVKEAVGRYGYNGDFWQEKPNPRPVTAWEVWNEPDLVGNDPVIGKAGCEAINQTYYEAQNTCIQPEAYGSFLVYTAEAIQDETEARAGHGPQVLFGGLNASYGENDATFLKKASGVSGGANSYSGVSLHPYSFVTNQEVAGVQANINEIRNTLDNEIVGGHYKSLWITELGWSLQGGNLPPGGRLVDEETQARLLTESFDWIKSVAAGFQIELVTWYNLRDGGGENWDGHCGLLDPVGNHREAWFAFQREAGAPVWPGPNVETVGASVIQETQAVLNGVLDPHGNVTTYYFEYGRSAEYGRVTEIKSLNTSGQTGVSLSATGLQPGTTYHFRLVATSGGITTDGADKVFTIPGYRYMQGLIGTTGAVSWRQMASQALPLESATGDFNGDGKTDIFQVEFEGNGKYRYRVGYSSGSGIASWSTILSNMDVPAEMRVGDFNGDGKADIVSVEPEGNGKYRYMLGTSNGSGISSWSQVLGGLSYPERMAMGDFNGDGKVDVLQVESQGSGQYRVMRGLSTGSGISSWTQVLGGLGYQEFFDAGDVNGDGKADIVSVESEGSGKYRFMRGLSNGTGISSWSQLMGGMSQPYYFDVGDIDGDGRSDVLSLETIE